MHSCDVDTETVLWWLLPPLEVAWLGGATVYIVLQRRGAAATVAWVLTLTVLPVIGIALYFFFGPRRYEKRKKRRARAQAEMGRRTIHDPQPTQDLSSQAADLIRLCENTVGQAARLRRGTLQLFNTGAEKYAALEVALANAEHHIHLEYYIWEPDTIGTRLRDRLVERARSGVEVRVLVDGFGSSKAHDRFWRPLREAGGEVRRFNALTLTRWRPRMANFRTHRKIAVIDGTVGFTGGMNVSDVHTAEVSGDDAWRDTHARIDGSAVKGLQLVFFEDWHYATGSAPDGHAYVPPGDEGEGELLQIVSSGPDENLDAIHKLYFSAIAGSHQRVWLTTPYFVPDDSIVHALSAAALRGADVRVLVPEKGDVPVVAAAARSYYPELLEVGVKIFEHTGPVLHAKTLIVDDYLAVVGTANTDNRSFRLNFEVLVAAYERGTCDTLGRDFHADLRQSRRVTRKDLNRVTFAERLVTSTARLLSPLL